MAMYNNCSHQASGNEGRKLPRNPNINRCQRQKMRLRKWSKEKARILYKVKKRHYNNVARKIWCIIREHIRKCSTFIEAKDAVDWKIIVPKWQRFLKRIKASYESKPLYSHNETLRRNIVGYISKLFTKQIICSCFPRFDVYFFYRNVFFSLPIFNRWRWFYTWFERYDTRWSNCILTPCFLYLHIFKWTRWFVCERMNCFFFCSLIRSFGWWDFVCSINFSRLHWITLFNKNWKGGRDCVCMNEE